MFRIDDPSAAAALPTPEAAGTEGYWTEGNPGSNIPATLARASFLNMIQEELRNIVTAAGVTPSKTTYNQVLTALQKTFGGVVGATRNVLMYVATASATATLTADEIVLETALGGQPFRLANFNKTVNLATTGAGGMDTGAAPVSGYVALYAIYNPTTGVSALLAKNATAAVQPSVYGGANMPAGYTASALVAVVPTNGSGQIAPVLLRDRVVGIPIKAALSTSTVQGALASLSIAGVVPPNATSVSGELSMASTLSSTAALTVASDANALCQQNATASVGTAGYVVNFSNVYLATAQTIYWNSTNTAGTPTYNIYVSSYTF